MHLMIADVCMQVSKQWVGFGLLAQANAIVKQLIWAIFQPSELKRQTLFAKPISNIGLGFCQPSVCGS